MDHITKSYLGKSDVVVNFQITKEDDVFVAQCVELPGCISQGDTMEEAKANIASALEEFLPIFIHDAIMSSKNATAGGGSLPTFSLNYEVVARRQ